MNVELLYFPDCPSYERALELVHEALKAEGIDAEVRLICIETEGEAEQHRFVGSPTIRFNGIEVAPAPHLPYRLACRVFQHEDGRFLPVPSLQMLRQTIQSAKMKEERDGS